MHSYTNADRAVRVQRQGSRVIKERTQRARNARIVGVRLARRQGARARQSFALGAHASGTSGTTCARPEHGKLVLGIWGS